MLKVPIVLIIKREFSFSYIKILKIAFHNKMHTASFIPVNKVLLRPAITLQSITFFCKSYFFLLH